MIENYPMTPSREKEKNEWRIWILLLNSHEKKLCIYAEKNIYLAKNQNFQ